MKVLFIAAAIVALSAPQAYAEKQGTTDVSATSATGWTFCFVTDSNGVVTDSKQRLQSDLIVPNGTEERCDPKYKDLHKRFLKAQAEGRVLKVELASATTKPKRRPERCGETGSLATSRNRNC